MSWVKINEREHVERFWYLTCANLFSGATAIYVKNIIQIPPPPNSVINSIPGSYAILGIILLSLGLACIVARSINSKALRFVHAVGCGYYFMLAFLLIVALFYGSPYSFTVAPYFGICAWLHYRAATELEPFKLAPLRRSDDG